MSTPSDTLHPKSATTSKRGSVTPLRYRQALQQRTNHHVAPIKRGYPRSSLRPSECDDSGRASARPASPQSTGAFSSQGQQTVSGRSHKPAQLGSIPSPASDDWQDNLRAPRGIAIALALVAPFWALFVYVVFTKW